MIGWTERVSQPLIITINDAHSNVPGKPIFPKKIHIEVASGAQITATPQTWNDFRLDEPTLVSGVHLQIVSDKPIASADVCGMLVNWHSNPK